MSNDDLLEEVAVCIRTALKIENDRAGLRTIGGPRTTFFALWLNSELTLEQLTFLAKMAEKEGEDAMYDWLNEVLVSSGLYERDSDGEVTLKA